jgi:hypothetical protein
VFGGNGGLLGCTIGNPELLGGLGGPGGSKQLHPRSNGWLAKTMFTYLGISSWKLTNFDPLGVCGLDLTPSSIWTGVDTNIISIIIIIDWGIITQYYGTNLTSLILKFEIPT